MRVFPYQVGFLSSNLGESMRVMGSLPCLKCQPWHTAVPVESISRSNSLTIKSLSYIFEAVAYFDRRSRGLLEER